MQLSYSRLWVLLVSNYNNTNQQLDSMLKELQLVELPQKLMGSL